MAAPSTAYLNNGSVLSIHIPGVIKLDSLLALKLLEYGENIKSLFYLDGLLILKNGSDLGFIGFVDEGGNNYKYHNPARFSKKRLKNGATRILLNDSGLNTKGHAEITDLNRSLLKDVDTVKAFFKSAYYLDSTFIFVDLDQPGQSGGSVGITGPLKQQSIEQDLPINYNDLEFKNVSVRAGIENAEGIFASEPIIFVLRPENYHIYIEVENISDGVYKYTATSYANAIDEILANPEQNIQVDFIQNYTDGISSMDPIPRTKNITITLINGVGENTVDFSGDVTHPGYDMALEDVVDKVATPAVIDTRFGVLFRDDAPAPVYRWLIDFSVEAINSFDLRVTVYLLDEETMTTGQVEDDLEITYTLNFFDSEGFKSITRTVTLTNYQGDVSDIVDTQPYTMDSAYNLDISSTVLENVTPNFSSGRFIESL